MGTIPFVMVFAAWFGASGVLIGQAVGGVLFGLVAVAVAMRVMRQGGGLGTPEGFDKQSRAFSWLHRNR